MYDGSLTRALRHIYTTEGFAGLYKGVTLAWVKAPIAVALSFTINDFLKQSVRTYVLSVRRSREEKGKEKDEKRYRLKLENLIREHSGGPFSMGCFGSAVCLSAVVFTCACMLTCA